MTPTLCPHCGWHVGRCRCAVILYALERSREYVEEALSAVERDHDALDGYPTRQAQKAAESRGVEVDLALIDDAIRALANPKGDA